MLFSCGDLIWFYLLICLGFGGGGGGGGCSFRLRGGGCGGFGDKWLRLILNFVFYGGKRIW